MNWIPVRDRMPKVGETEVLVCAGLWIGIAYWNAKGKWRMLDVDGTEVHNVTHWMPLPDYPDSPSTG